MARESSVAPKERINIVYKPANNMDEEIELPFKMVVLGDFTGRPDSTLLEERRVINVDKDNFNQVLAEQNLSLSFGVRDRLSPDAKDGDELPVNVQIKNMRSFQPDELVQQIPELKSLLEIREALVAMKGPLGNVKEFSRKLREVLSDEGARQRLLRELKLDEGSGSEG